VIVGERTYGKGTVQQLVPLESGRSLLKLTWASFWRPSGRKIHRTAGSTADDAWGVSPNRGLERKLTTDEYADYREYRADRDSAADTTDIADTQLQVAIDYLREKLDAQPSQPAK
jgi:carboxyl-terminal processing protease